MNNFIETVMAHRTIREFKDEEVSEKDLQIIIDGTMRTASSAGLQQASIIRVSDTDKKKAVAELCGQEFIERFPELFIFIVDLYRNDRLIQDQGLDSSRKSHTDKFLQAFIDASLMAQNANNIIESLGMGAVFIGSILSDPQKMIEILNLPELTFPVVGLGFGYPNENPSLKPRIDKKYRLFENEYKVFDNYTDEFTGYDEEMTKYVDLRFPDKNLDPFSKIVVDRNIISSQKRIQAFEIAKNNGFKF